MKTIKFNELFEAYDMFNWEIIELGMIVIENGIIVSGGGYGFQLK